MEPPDANTSTTGEPDPVPPPPPTLTSAAQRLVTVRTADWSASNGTLQLWNRTAAGWQAVGNSIPIVLGRSGLAWARGLHGEGSVLGLDGAIKMEGDGNSPAGAFWMNLALGRAPSAPPGATIPYQSFTPTLQCVEDTGSRQYNRIVDRATTPVDWSGTQVLARTDLYEWLLFVEQNVTPAPVPDAAAASCFTFGLREPPLAAPQCPGRTCAGWCRTSARPTTCLFSCRTTPIEHCKMTGGCPRRPRGSRTSLLGGLPISPGL